MKVGAAGGRENHHHLFPPASDLTNFSTGFKPDPEEEEILRKGERGGGKRSRN